jgi:dTDP-4-dehydrorhamnose 3,5-epimerase
MSVEVRASAVIEGVALVASSSRGDRRGTFVETYRREWFPDGAEMVQANRADRVAGCVVGLHYHLHQTDYWQVIGGHARVVLHDLRVASPTEGATEVLDLGEFDGRPQNQLGLSIPPGVAHGFASLTPLTLTYLVDRYYDPDDELGLAWDDPAVDADWGIAEPLLSDRDRANPPRAQVPAERLPRHEPPR